MSGGPLLEVSSLVKTYRLPGAGPFARKNARPALAGVSFSIEQGRSFGIVGESGSGKSTLARIALALDRPDSGVVRLEGRSLFDLPRRELRATRAHMQMVFQDPYGSLDPRQRVEKIVAEPLAALGGATGAERRARVRASLEAVGLSISDASKYPHEFSGGQRQRIAIARALITRPRLVVADEPVSALDVSVQAQTLNLMSDLEREAGVTFLLISHDLAVVAHICVTTAVLYRGRIVEIGETDALFSNPAHPYTRELVDATPRLDRPARAPLPPAERDAVGWNRHREDPRALGTRGDAAIQEPSGALRSPGLLRHSPSGGTGVFRRPIARNDEPGSVRQHDVPRSGAETAEGCPYAGRCAFARPRCLEEPPRLEAKGDGSRRVACWYPLD
jgi:ABC-type oligopeptide transport system ATPase subunit